jgi:hypothetical protein
MELGMFGGFEVSLRKWLFKECGAEWCDARSVKERTFNDLIHDPDIRPQMSGFIHRAVQRLGRTAEDAEVRRAQVLEEHDTGKEYWGSALALVEPTEMEPLASIEIVEGLQAAYIATGDWAFGLKEIVGTEPNVEQKYYPPFLVLNGVPGCGKTRLAKAACYMLWRHRNVLFTTERNMVALLHGAIASQQVETVTEELMNIPNLIYDDFGAAAITPGSWAHSKRDEILSHRWEHQLRTMITTNLQSADLREVSARLASRMMDAKLAVNVAITAGDYRQKER